MRASRLFHFGLLAALGCSTGTGSEGASTSDLAGSVQATTGGPAAPSEAAGQASDPVAGSEGRPAGREGAGTAGDAGEDLPAGERPQDPGAGVQDSGSDVQDPGSGLQDSAQDPGSGVQDSAQDSGAGVQDPDVSGQGTDPAPPDGGLGDEPSAGLQAPGLGTKLRPTWKTYSGLWSPADNWRGKDVSSVGSELPNSSWSLGAYDVRWDADRSQLSVTDAQTGRVLWQSFAGKPFLLAGRGQEKVVQWRGSFTISDKAGSERCRAQWLTDARQDASGLSLKGTLSGPDCHVGFELKFSLASPRRLAFQASVQNAGKTDPAELNRIFLVYASDANERFYGFGEQFTYFDLKGRAVPILSQEQGHTRGRQPYTWLLNKISPGAAGSWATTYAAVPQYLTSRNRGLFLEDYEVSVFNLTDDDRVEIRLWSNQIKGQILRGDSYFDLIEAYTEFAGRMPMVPDWFHKGAIVGLMGGSGFVREVHAKLKALDAPIAGYWIQDWVGKRVTELGTRMWWNWSLDRSVYPDWEQLLQEFKDEDIEVLGYINPFLSDASSNPNHSRNLFEEAKALGYLTTWANGSPAEIDSGGFTGTLVDLSNPQARAWLEDIIVEQLIGNGMKGWMADFGEALPFDVQLASGDPAASLHNRFPEWWAEVNRNAIRRAGLEGEAVAFLRCGFTRSPRHVPMFWVGDQMVTWDEDDGLKSSITGLLSGGMSGFSLNHSDIGGLIALKRTVAGIQVVNFARDQELHMRWAELNAFTTAYRTHEGNNPTVSHQFYSADATMAHYVYFAKVFASLAGYRKQLFRQASEKGYPVSRHMILHYPDDPRAAQQNYQLMLGPDFLVAPVTEPEVDSWKVYLPKGHWVHLWSGENFGSALRGIEVEVAAPLGQPPVFFKAGSPYGQRARDAIMAIPSWKSVSP